MNDSLNSAYIVGDWHIDTSSGEMSANGNVVQLEARTMRLLAYLISRAGDIVSMDDMLLHVWPGLVVTPDSVYQAITALRRALGDDSKQPSYIATIPKFGYRLVAKVESVSDRAATVSTNTIDPVVVPDNEFMRGPQRGRSHIVVAAVACAIAALCLAVWIQTRSNGVKEKLAANVSAPAGATATSQQAIKVDRTIAVLPLQDMTEQMNEEPFADGMTEELISKLSKISGLSVASPLASLSFKDQPVDLKQVANALHVSFIVNGSVRKSGNKLRVTARLTRVRDGFVVWSETYDRAWHDKLMIQDDIASEVAGALTTSIN